MPTSRGFTRKCINKVSRSVWTLVYLVLTSQVEARSSVAGNLTSEVDAQQVFKNTFNALISEDYSIVAGIDRYQSTLEDALLQVNFLVRARLYMLPSNLTLKNCESLEKL